MERILLVEGDPLEARTLSSYLSEEYSVLHCAEPRWAPEAARRGAPAAVLLGLPPSFGGRDELIRRTRDESPGAPLIVLSSDADPRVVVGCLRSGASDFLAKPCEPAAVRRCLAATASKLRSEAARASPFVGASRAMREVEEQVRLYAESDLPVLVLGESGTGKEVAAMALRDFSSRRSDPFIALNCAAIPEQLAESELFGTERGAFTDAVSRPGAFELARGGLLFLDEIGEAGPALQSKLLRVLESGEYRRLGSRKKEVADFRLVSATGRDLERAAREGRFRPDLLYRVDTLIIEIPPLRDRREDIAELAAHFAHLESGGSVAISPEALGRLEGYSWPGNIRQLRNIVQRALVLARGREEIRAEHIVLR
jgi:two-component system, NtrC family, response regulator AtoC